MPPTKVFLVRHAESEQNIATERLSMWDIRSLITVLKIGLDSNLSEHGKVQLSELQSRLKSDNFVQNKNIELVAYSHYKRARETAEALFKGNVEMTELSFLYERTPYEYITDNSVYARRKKLREWLSTRNEKNIVLVGHGQVWQQALEREEHQDNLSIIECDFDPNSIIVSGLVFKNELYVGMK